MSDTLKKIKQRDFNSIDQTELTNLIYRISGLKNSEKLYKILFHELVNKIDDFILIECIYDVKCLENHIFYLLNRNRHKLYRLKMYIFDYIISNTTWGKNVLTENIDLIAENNMDVLTTYFSKNKQLCLEILDSFKNKKHKLDFITYALDNYSINFLREKDILSALCHQNIKKLNISDDNALNKLRFVPNTIGSLLLLQKCGVNDNYIQIAEKYSKSFFDSEKDSKIKFLSLLENDKNNLKSKYKVALELYHKSLCSARTDVALSHLIQYGNYDKFCEEILKLSPNLIIKTMTIENTATSNVFIINNSIIKLGDKRFNCNINPNFFRIIPCKITYIRDFSGKVCAVTEFEDNIDTNPDHIDTDMIYELLVDFKNNGLCICDPNCLKFDKSNFGLLKSYRDANLGEYKSHDELPENFKKNPLVLLDVDLIYKYGEVDPAVASNCKVNMDKAIEMYEEGLAKRKVKS